LRTFRLVIDDDRKRDFVKAHACRVALCRRACDKLLLKSQRFGFVELNAAGGVVLAARASNLLRSKTVGVGGLKPVVEVD